MILGRVLIFAAFVLALLVARARPRHRPIAVALLVVLVASCARSALPDGGAWRRVSLALLMAPAVAGAWSAAAALGACPRPGTAALCAWAGLAAVVGFSGRPVAWWASALPAVHILGAGLQVASFWRWAIREDRPVTVTERTLLALLAGDVAATVAPIVGGGPWELARIASGVALLAACIVQAAEIHRRESVVYQNERRTLPPLIVVVDGKPGPLRREWIDAWGKANAGDPCARCGHPLVDGWQGAECERCEREFDETHGCKCGGTNLCPDCQAAGATEATRGTIRCDPDCSTLCPVCCPDD